MASTGDTVSIVDYLKARLDSQDTKLDAISKSVAGIHKQTKETNGRVTELEAKDRVSEAIRNQNRTTLAGRRWWIQLVAGCACMGIGGLFSVLVQSVHP